MKRWPLLCITLSITVQSPGEAGIRGVETEPRILNAREIPAYFSALTGVSPEESAIKEYMRSNRSRFPDLGQLHEANTSFFLGLLSYASLYCSELVSHEASQAPQDRRVFPQVDFQKPFSQFQVASSRTLMVQGLGMHFWFRLPNQQEASTFEQELILWLQDPSSSSVTSTRLNLISLCSIYMSSADVWLRSER